MGSGTAGPGVSEDRRSPPFPGRCVPWSSVVWTTRGPRDEVPSSAASPGIDSACPAWITRPLSELPPGQVQITAPLLEVGDWESGTAWGVQLHLNRTEGGGKGRPKTEAGAVMRPSGSRCWRSKARGPPSEAGEALGRAGHLGGQFRADSSLGRPGVWEREGWSQKRAEHGRTVRERVGEAGPWAGCWLWSLCDLWVQKL